MYSVTKGTKMSDWGYSLKGTRARLVSAAAQLERVMQESLNLAKELYAQGIASAEQLRRAEEFAEKASQQAEFIRMRNGS